jgi:hypothetical protein
VIAPAVGNPSTSRPFDGTGALRLSRSTYNAGNYFYWGGDIEDVRLFRGVASTDTINEAVGT